mmetsp:Transcript_14931/g.43113  ORF Transcript_14931/g.43113 Transcript_14931/m.43113 type:complete len:592 (+) Transcript_14931:144-1919(+)
MRRHFSGHPLSISYYFAISYLVIAATSKSATQCLAFAFRPPSVGSYDLSPRRIVSCLCESKQKRESAVPESGADDEVINGSSPPDLIGNNNVHDHADHAHKHKTIDGKEYTHSHHRPRRKMELSWCGRNACSEGTPIRERIVGTHNHVEFEGPATGQVMYEWAETPSKAEVGAEARLGETGRSVAPPSVLLLVKRGDDKLLKVAAEAVQNLTALDIDILLHPELSAKMKHYFGVDSENIKLFEPLLVPGYGGSHLKPRGMTKAQLQENLEKHRDRYSSSDDTDAGPDLICTLGGDGLLMYASTLFQGPVPPILCVAGGSMGFLTPFQQEEMVDAIATALGIVKDEETNESSIDEGPAYFPGGGVEPVAARPIISPSYTDEEGSQWSGLTEHPDFYDDQYLKPKFKFGAYNRICLSMRMRLDCRIVNREGVVRARFSVLNEVVIDRGSSPYLANLECFCDDVHLTTVQADGVIFSTPSGSTAYSMSAGGSVVHPAVPAILVTPICPHVLSFRPMVFPDHVVLRCYVPDDARADASVAFDGKARRELHRGDSVQIQMSAHPVPTINRMDHSSDWLNSLKRNFNFNSRVRQGPL